MILNHVIAASHRQLKLLEDNLMLIDSRISVLEFADGWLTARHFRQLTCWRSKELASASDMVRACVSLVGGAVSSYLGKSYCSDTRSPNTCPRKIQ
jgi:hypothetical protein